MYNWNQANSLWCSKQLRVLALHDLAFIILWNLCECTRQNTLTRPCSICTISSTQNDYAQWHITVVVLILLNVSCPMMIKELQNSSLPHCSLYIPETTQDLFQACNSDSNHRNHFEILKDYKRCMEVTFVCVIYLFNNYLYISQQ